MKKRLRASGHRKPDVPGLALPFPLFCEMEEKAKKGVFDGPIWKELAVGRH
ncbi:MAG: hypothetical protein WC295_10580 [Methanoregula sp.]